MSLPGMPMLASLWRRCGRTSVSKLVPGLEVGLICVDYMHRRRVFSLDPDYFPLDRMQEIVKYLHDHEQKYSMCPSLLPYTTVLTIAL